MRLVQSGQFCQRPAAQQTEIASVARNGDAAQFFNQKIKHGGGDALAEFFLATIFARGIDHVVTLPVRFEHLHDHGGRILQIRVQRHHHVAARRLQSGGQRELMA